MRSVSVPVLSKNMIREDSVQSVAKEQMHHSLKSAAEVQVEEQMETASVEKECLAGMQMENLCLAESSGAKDAVIVSRCSDRGGDLNK